MCCQCTLRFLRRIVEFGIEVSSRVVLESILCSLCDNGTLLLSQLNIDFPYGAAFNVRNSLIHIGSCTEVECLWPRVVRKGHLIYSFVAIRNKAKLFCGLKNFNGYGESSPFGLIHRNGDKIGVMDVSTKAA